MKNKNLTGSWKIGPIIFFAIIILGFLSYSAYKEFSKKKEVESEIEILRQQAEKIKQENMSLEERIAYLGSQDYQKIQAKDKLDLQDPNENVVIITQDLAAPVEENRLLHLPLARPAPTGGLTLRNNPTRGQRRLLSKGLPRSANHRGDHAPGPRTLPRAGDPPGLPAALAIRNVPGRPQDHPADGFLAQSHPGDGSKGTLHAPDRPQPDSLPHGPGGQSAHRGAGADQLQRQLGCSPAILARNGPSSL